MKKYAGMYINKNDKLIEKIISQRVANILISWGRLVKSNIFVYKSNDDERFLFLKLYGSKYNFSSEIIYYFKNTKWGIFSKKYNSFITERAITEIQKRVERNELSDDYVREDGSINMEIFENYYVDINSEKEIIKKPLIRLYEITINNK